MLLLRRLFAVLVMVVVIVAGVLGLNLLVFLRTPYGDITQNVNIDRGTSLDGVVRRLEEKKVIASVPLFKAYVFFRRAVGRIRAGEFTFPPKSTPREVLALLMKGDFAKHRITIPEGWTSRDIASYLGGLGLVDSEAFLARTKDLEFIQSLGLQTTSLEGYLYPDTYEIYKPKDEREVLRKLVEHFKQVYSKNFEARAMESGVSRNDLINLASIIEKETGNKEERPLIASVFWNRLKKGMPLASDPTIIYGIPNFNGNLTHQDLTRPGPYNSYLNPGLPPTPICNPGKESIRAVLYPAETKYLFFVSKNDGTHYFSETEEEHEAAVRKYQLNRPRQEELAEPVAPEDPR